jgi:hypothetical protein
MELIVTEEDRKFGAKVFLAEYDIDRFDEALRDLGLEDLDEISCILEAETRLHESSAYLALMAKASPKQPFRRWAS